MSLDDSLTVDNVTLTSSCLGLTLGQLRLVDSVQHIFVFPGQVILQDATIDQTLIVYSLLTNPYHQFGNFYKFYSTNDDGLFMTTFFTNNSSDYISTIPNANISIFDSELSTEIMLTNSLLTFKGTTMVFDYYEISVVGNTLITDDPDAVALNIDGQINQGTSKFLSRIALYLTTHLEKEVRNIVERQANAATELQNAQIRLNQLAQQFDKASQKLNQLTNERDTASNITTMLNTTVQNAKLNFETALQLYNDNSGMDLNLESICVETTCACNCHPGVQCSTCGSTESIETFGICEKDYTHTRVVKRYRQVPITSWKYEERCSVCKSVRLWLISWYISTDTCCRTESVPFTDYRDEPYHIEEQVTKIIQETCVLENVTVQTSSQCCQESLCTQMIKDANCTIETMKCQKRRLKSIQTLNVTLAELYETYVAATDRLTIAELELAGKEVALTAYTQQYNAIYSSYNAANISYHLSNMTVQLLKEQTKHFDPLIDLTKDAIDRSDTIIEVHNISFSLSLISQTPTAVPITIYYSVINYELSRSLDITVNLAESEEIILHTISEAILFQLYESGASLNSRTRRQLDDSENDNLPLLPTCNQLKNIKQFIEQVQSPLSKTLSTFKETTDIVTSVAKNYSSLSTYTLQQNIDSNEALRDYLDSLSQVANMSQESVTQIATTLEQDALAQWQLSLKVLHTNGSNVGGDMCASFSDCLFLAYLSTALILEDTPNATTISATLQGLKFDIVDIGYSDNITLLQANTSIANFIDIFTAIHDVGYWCADPPSIVTNPLPEHNVSVGQSTTLECQAMSTLPLHYHWRKDGVILSGQKSNVLTLNNIQRSEAGEYYCVATSDAGVATSLSTTVNVYYSPIFNLTLDSPVVTYEGYDNEVYLACDARSWPRPGWRWSFKPVGSGTWREVNGANTNILTFSTPESSHEGQYRCEAYNVVGHVQSDPVSVTVLPATIVRLQYQVASQFTVSNGNTLNIDMQSLVDRLFGGLNLENIDTSSIQVDPVDSILSVSFNLLTPATLYDPSDNIEDLVSSVGPRAQSLEEDKNTIEQHLASSDGYSVVIDSNVELVHVPDSLRIGPKQCICPNGYTVHSSLIICSKLLIQYVYIILLYI